MRNLLIMAWLAMGTGHVHADICDDGTCVVLQPADKEKKPMDLSEYFYECRQSGRTAQDCNAEIELNVLEYAEDIDVVIISK